jgi:hypothetical protein
LIVVEIRMCRSPSKITNSPALLSAHGMNAVKPLNGMLSLPFAPGSCVGDKRLRFVALVEEASGRAVGYSARCAMRAPMIAPATTS